MYDEPRFLIAGDRSLFVEFGNEISPEANRLVFNLKTAIEKACLPGIIDLVPTYRTLVIYYDPIMMDFNHLKHAIQNLSYSRNISDLSRQTTIEVPVFYGGKFGPDLDFVASHNKLTPEEVIEIHSGATYLVYMNGFMPGFPYLGGMSEKIATPRLKTPRIKVPAGSVGIAGKQTGIYPSDNPGGWQIIGRTPLTLFDPLKKPPVLLCPGSFVKFKPVSEGEFLSLRRSIKHGSI